MKYDKIDNGYFFQCTLCGNCCTGDQTVLLNRFDLWKMGRFLNFSSTRQLFDKGYLELFRGEQNVFFPKIRFKTKPWKFCPFLINEMDDDGRLYGKCSMHQKHKPLICSLAPVARVVDFTEKTDEYYFVPPAPDCSGIDSKNWIELSDL